MVVFFSAGDGEYMNKYYIPCIVGGLHGRISRCHLSKLTACTAPGGKRKSWTIKEKDRMPHF